jgi:CheY-like chemotaxis protein
VRQARKILVVDDDADWREYLRVCLEELGYQVDEAATGEEALERVRDGGWSVMLLDLRMPGLSGEAVVAQLPPNPPHIVVLTAASADEARTTLGRGPHYYLPKQASRQELGLLLEALT